MIQIRPSRAFGLFGNVLSVAYTLMLVFVGSSTRILFQLICKLILEVFSQLHIVDMSVPTEMQCEKQTGRAGLPPDTASSQGWPLALFGVVAQA